MEHGQLYLVFVCLFGLAMTWGVGANDLANVMSTTMGSKALTTRQALIIALIFEFAGAFLGGSDVTDTMRHGIINLNLLNDQPMILVWGMASVLLASMLWINFASYMGIPVSITNAIVGSVIGFGLIELGPQAIHWKQVSYIAISWISSPMIAGVFAYFLFLSIQRLIFARRDPLAAAKRYIPLYLFMVGLVLSFITVIKGLEHFEIILTPIHKLLVGLGSGILVMIVGMIAIRHLAEKASMRRRDNFRQIEKMFGVLMGLTACAMVFAHGSNDVAVSVGPIAMVFSIVSNAGNVVASDTFPGWITLLGCSGVVIGLMSYGYKVIETVGSGITALTPSRAFAATIAAATAVVVSTSTGIPVSTTQTLVGAVLGVGLARGIGALNLVVVRNIFMSWIITIPVASIITILIFNGFKVTLGN